MSGIKSSSGIKSKTYAYENFQGLDTSRDITSLDTGKEQHMARIHNATSDWRGQMVRDAACAPRKGEYKVNHTCFFGDNELLWVEETGSGLTFNSDRDHTLVDVHPSAAVMSSTVFNKSVHLAARGRPMYSYDGVLYRRNNSQSLDKMRPAYVKSIQRRLCVAGINGKETQVHLSRVDNDEIFPEDEDPTSENVLRAGYIDIGNLLGTADQITGIGTFEQNRLAVFTADQSIIYRIDPDINQWLIDESANINIGCISHNTIVNAGTDLLYCSRAGIHSIKRSEDNGILVYSYSISDKIDLLYRELFNSVENPNTISAVFDQDTAQYHVFFPQSGGQITKRLTLAMNPEGGEGGQPKFSTGDFLNARCGSFLNGRLVWGTTGGVFNVLQVDDKDTPDAVTPNLEIITPLFWHGSLDQTKETISVTIQASGEGIVYFDAEDEKGRKLGSLVFEVNDTSDDNYFQDVPLSHEYERKWAHRYRAARYRMRTEGGMGLLRIIGFAVTVRKR